jgi:hypothetical protein
MHPTTIFLVPPSSWEQRKEQTRDKGKTELEPHLGPAGNPPPHSQHHLLRATNCLTGEGPPYLTVCHHSCGRALVPQAGHSRGGLLLQHLGQEG